MVGRSAMTIAETPAVSMRRGLRIQHAWLKNLDSNRIDLGKGKRMLVRGGKLDPKFKITVPESIDAGG